MQRWSCTQHKTDAPPLLLLPLSIVPHWQDLTPASATLQLTRGGGWRGTAQLYLFPMQPSPHSGLTECLLRGRREGRQGAAVGGRGADPGSASHSVCKASCFTFLCLRFLNWKMDVIFALLSYSKD